jgi:peptidoglycan/xylan/chitin deacetylase (PgdA/CDA1 family)
MQTELNVENKIHVQFPYLRYIVIILLVGLFSFWAFPGQSSIGQPEKIVVKPPSATQGQNNAYFMDEEELLQLKKHHTENKIGGKKPKDYPALSGSVLASKFIRQGPDVNQVAITFDDGPFLLTEKYIEVLQAYDVQATFFLIGVQVEKYPDDAKMIIESGYEIGIHSYGHKQLTRMGSSSIDNDFRKSITAIGKVADADIRFFRPPFGDFNDSVIQTAKNHNLTTILWCVDPRDWQKDDPYVIARHVIEKAENGAIILLHEGREGTLAALPLIIEGLWERGFEIVSLSELLSTVEKDLQAKL